MDIKVIHHKDIDKNSLLEICKIKSVFGDYTIESQVKWIKENINDNDIHFLLYNSEKLVGYLNVVIVDVKVDNETEKVYGVGNVCVNNKGKGVGKELMQELNNFIVEKGKMGLLFCKENLINFYTKCNWETINLDSIKTVNTNPKVVTMVFNKQSIISKLEYSGKLF